ncbi:hypothetical protein [Vibrio sp. WXL210]|uniref:hypothetical protein n=1 Tax=Vibrio sp. WXL210 TaxID=3450709 RepID=UPI003EC63D14
MTTFTPTGKHARDFGPDHVSSDSAPTPRHIWDGIESRSAENIITGLGFDFSKPEKVYLSKRNGLTLIWTAEDSDGDDLVRVRYQPEIKIMSVVDWRDYEEPDRCIRCSRVLDTDEGIMTGICPTCWTFEDEE